MNVPDDPDALVTIQTAASEFEANALVALLADAGIRAFAFPLAKIPVEGPFAQSPASLPVQVARRDVVRAKREILLARSAADEIDWDSVELGDGEDRVSDSLVLRGGRVFAGLGRVVALGVVALIALAIVVACVLAMGAVWGSR